MAIAAAICACKKPVFQYQHESAEFRCIECGGKKNPALETIMPGEPKMMTVGEGAVDDRPRIDIEFAEELNPVSIFRLRDGSVLKAKMVLMHVERIEGAYNPDGTPMYGLGWQQVVYIVSPPELRRK